jgi:hypothetical protein
METKKRALEQQVDAKGGAGGDASKQMTALRDEINEKQKHIDQLKVADFLVHNITMIISVNTSRNTTGKGSTGEELRETESRRSRKIGKIERYLLCW